MSKVQNCQSRYSGLDNFDKTKCDVNESSFFKLIHCKFLKFENGQNGRRTRRGDFELFGPVDLSVQLKFFKGKLSKLHKKYSLIFGFKSK